MTSAQRSKFERHLLTERARHERTLSQLAEEARNPVGDRGRPGDDLRSSALGGSTGDDEAIVAHATRDLEEIDRALERLRMDPEHYGRCTACARPISLERLAIVPGTQYCQLHAHD